jgi:hypothetical protein
MQTAGEEGYSIFFNCFFNNTSPYPSPKERGQPRRVLFNFNYLFFSESKPRTTPLSFGEGPGVRCKRPEAKSNGLRKGFALSNKCSIEVSVNYSKAAPKLK